MTAAAILANLERRGIKARINERGTVSLSPADALDAAEIASLKLRRDELVAELQRREWSEAGRLCTRCRAIGVVRTADGVCRHCVAGEEWAAVGCAVFTALADAANSANGVCIACGISWREHGSPNPTTWRRIADPDDVALAAARFVVATARDIARGGAR